MSNPFEDDDANGEIVEGFLCPICREDLRTLESLTTHFEREHAEEQDTLSLFKDIFTKAKKKIGLKTDEDNSLSQSMQKQANISSSSGSGETQQRTTNNRPLMNVYNFMEHQEPGQENLHFEYFKTVRNPRLERYASETNKLIIRLHKLLQNMPTDPVLRKQHEQNVVSWLNGTSVNLCPSCARSFHIARRQHHCRLCGTIMCHDCSKFLALDVAVELASMLMPQSESSKLHSNNPSSSSNTQQQRSLRTCDHCLWLLETRQDMQESRTCFPPISQIYSDIQKLRKEVTPDIEMYLKIIASLYEGESIFTLSDASALRGKIGQVAESIDLRSKRILNLPCQQGSREESLKKAIRLSCIQLIKEKMLSLPPLPAEETIRKIQERKRMEAEQRIATERRMAQEAYEKYGLVGSADKAYYSGSKGAVHSSDLQSLTNWSSSVSAANMQTHSDPLVEQINIIKGYIKQARQEMNFEVVETLELNLRELQREFYERQQSSSSTHDDNLSESATKEHF